MLRVSDLSVDDLRALLREVVEEKLGMLVDPDEGMELRPELEESLRAYLESDRTGDDADEVFRSLGLE
mgnify:CR=1 FL=1